MSPEGGVRSYLLMSTMGGALVIFVALAGYRDPAEVEMVDRAVVGLALIASSVLGISMALRPNWRGRLVARWGGTHEVPGGEGSGDGGPPPGPRRRGHHPECDAFGTHTVTWRGRVLCAGCTGLALGSLAVIALAATYVPAPDIVSWTVGPGLVMVGLSLVALDLLAAWAGGIAPEANLGLNALMVVGFALTAIGLLEATGEAAWGIMGVLVSFLWLDTRVQLSRWNHAAVCQVCPEECKAYFF